MPNYICTTCGIQYAETPAPPDSCPICEDERQFVGSRGQQWTTFDALQKYHRLVFKPDKEDPRIIAITIEPEFAIGQRAFLLRTPRGNILWDCLSLIDPSSVEHIRALGGLECIVISHPHFFDSCVEWSRAFGGIPVYIAAEDRQWMMRPDDCINFWEGTELELTEDVKVIKCGGHFDGSSVLLWKRDPKPVLFTADTIFVNPDKSTSFMFSYPNLIPLHPDAVHQIWSRVKPYEFEQIFGGFAGREIREHARKAVLRCAKRYIAKAGYKGHAIENEEL
ncbi:uncharacterized protein VTP21DRAFT_5425 [Calcarisporiella thermophila]|uniref:uncharacterized protein n=1 Tax=Calcarisporiella thermophila TaxID=911321 RepID=UPI003743FFB6